MAPQRTVRRAGAIVLSAAFVAACGGTDPDYSSDPVAEDDYAYCVRQEEGGSEAAVVDPDDCESYVHRGGFYPYRYFILRGRAHSYHSVGSKVRVADAYATAAANDPAARRAAGLPESGAVPHGSSRSGGFGGTAAAGANGDSGGTGTGSRGGTSGGFGDTGSVKGGGGSS